MLRRNTGLFAVILSACTMLAAVGLVTTGGWLISSAALMPPILTLQVATVSVRFFGISRAVFRWSERVVSHEAALQGTVENRMMLWNAASILGPRGIWRLRGNDALDRLTLDTELLQDEVTRVRTPFLAAACSAVLLVILQTINLPIAGLILLLTFMVSGIAIPLVTHRIESQVARDAVSVRNDLGAKVLELVKHSTELRISKSYGNSISKLSELEKRRIAVESKSTVWASVAQGLNGISSGFAVFAALLLAVTAYVNNELHGPMIAVVVLMPIASSEIMSTFGQAATANTRVAQAKERIEKLYTQAENRLMAAKVARESFLASPSELIVENLSVAWNANKVVNNVSFSLRRGESIAVTGPSGSGKSSLAAAVLRLVEHEGVVSLDEIPVERLTDFRAHVTAILQTTHVFNMTVRENLLIANGSATDAEILDALTKAGLSSWLQRVSLDTVVGQSGQNMSGGEIQRLGIARLLLSNAAFIVLDEPTEHLDEETADGIWATILSAFKDRGLLVITHDARIAAACTHQIKLQNGVVVPTLTP